MAGHNEAMSKKGREGGVTRAEVHLMYELFLHYLFVSLCYPPLLLLFHFLVHL